VPTLCLNLLNLSERYQTGIALEEQLDAAAEAGARLVGLEAGSIKRLEAEGRSVEALRKALDQRSLRCYELTYLECAPENEPATLAAAERVARWAGALGTSYVLTSAALPASDELADLFGRCCDVAARHGTGLAYEFFPWAPIDTFGAAHDLIQRAGRSNAGVLLDDWHFFHGPDDWDVLARVPLDAIAYVQFTDSIEVAPARYMAEAETCRRMPGDGCLDVERFARTLLDRGFDGVVSIEVLSAETRALGARGFARACMESSERYWFRA
jgi:sugar phosphate isomerase/epimerase